MSRATSGVHIVKLKQGDRVKFKNYLITTTLMDVVSEYFQKDKERLDRIASSLDRARELGQVERTKELYDELYKLEFNHYLFMSVLRTITQQIVKGEDRPRVKKDFEKIKESIASRCKEHSEILTDLVKAVGEIES